MYSKEEREKAIMLYIKYDQCAVDVIRELGYPDRKTLAGWYKTYLETGELLNRCSRRPKYSLEQKKAVVNTTLNMSAIFQGESMLWGTLHGKLQGLWIMNWCRAGIKGAPAACD